MKTQEQFGANARFTDQQAFDNAYKDYTQKYQDYNKNNQGGGLMESLGGFNVQKPVLSIGNTGQNRSPFAKGGLAKILEV